MRHTPFGNCWDHRRTAVENTRTMAGVVIEVEHKDDVDERGICGHSVEAMVVDTSTCLDGSSANSKGKKRTQSQ